MIVFLSVLMYVGVFILDYSTIQLMSPAVPLVGKSLGSLSFVLLAFLILRGKDTKKFKYKNLIFAGLCFGMAGDVLLSLSFFPGLRDSMFLAGLIAFLIGHIMYVLAFVDRSRVTVLSFVPMLVILSVFCFITRHFSSFFDFGQMYIPVLVYGAIVSFMLGMSAELFNCGKNSRAGATLSFWGAMMFFVSDFILMFLYFAPSVNPDVPGYSRAGYIILTLGNSILYYTGQLFLCLSLRHDIE